MFHFFYLFLIVSGDFNFRVGENEIVESLDSNYIDTWTHCHPDDPGFTHVSFFIVLFLVFVFSFSLCLRSFGQK